MTDRPWWEAAGPVEAVIVCGAARHRLRWEDDRLAAPDHPDPDGERLLVSLGGPKNLERCAAAIARAVLDGAVIGRARRAATRWLGTEISVNIDVLPSGATPTHRRSATHVDIALRPDWLTRVWGRDLAVINDAFTLDAIVTGPSGGTLHLATHAGESLHRSIGLPPIQATRP